MSDYYQVWERSSKVELCYDEIHSSDELYIYSIPDFQILSPYIAFRSLVVF